MEWYKTGTEGAQKAKEEETRRKEEWANRVSRFWLAPDKSTKILFLDSGGLVG